MPTTGSIFQGVTTAPCRDFIALQIVASGKKRVYMPCAGRFGSALAYIGHAKKTEGLLTSDICLFSSMIGHMFDDRHSIEELEIRNDSPIQPRSDSPEEVVAAAMLAIKYAQVKPSSLYGVNMRREIMSNREKYLEQIIERNKVMRDLLKGSRYDIQDVWDVIEEAAEDEDAALFVNVPTYKGGYDRMFQNSGISWNEPEIGQFNPDLFAKMEVTETFPSYFLGKHPDKHVIEVSYNNEFAEKFGNANLAKIDKYGETIFGHGRSETKATKTNWMLDNDIGGMLSVGVGGAITGEGADLLIIDDPIKNRQEAESETYRRRLYEEYQSTLYTRVQRNGAIIIVMTRWHEDDICGRLLNPSICDPEEWEIVNIPAVCETEDDLLGRRIGETIWPEIGYDEEWAAKTKAAVGTYAWAGMYQQRPAPLEGGLFKRDFFKFYKVLPSGFNEVVQSWDCTFKEADTSDFVAGHVWGRKGPDFYLCDRVHAKMGIVATMQSITSLTAKWPRARAKYIEEAANGAAVIELLKKKISGIVPVHPDGGKVVRAQAIMPFVEAGNVYLPDPSIAPWVHDFIEECANFPNALHDDDVDAMTQAINKLGSAPNTSLPPSDYGNDRASYWQR